MKFLQQFSLLILQLLAKQLLGMVGREFQQFGYVCEDWFFILDDAAIWRDSLFTYIQRIQSVDHLIRTCLVGQMKNNLHLRRSLIYDILDADFSFLIGSDNLLLQLFRLHSVWKVGDHQSLIVKFADMASHTKHTATFTIIISLDVTHTASREVGIQSEFLSLQVSDCGIQYLIEIVRHDLRLQRNGDTCCTLSQE